MHSSTRDRTRREKREGGEDRGKNSAKRREGGEVERVSREGRSKHVPGKRLTEVEEVSDDWWGVPEIPLPYAMLNGYSVKMILHSSSHRG